MAEAKKEKKDPFKTRKAKVANAAKEADAITPPAEIARAIDAFREAQEQAKHFEAEATVHKDAITHYAHSEFAKKLKSGDKPSLKFLGDEAMVTYVVQDSSAGLTDEDVAEISQRWGEEAAEALVERDFRSIRFDPKVLAAHYDTIVDALQVLPPDVLDNLFKPMLMKACTGALDKIPSYAKDSEDLMELMTALRIKNYVR